MQANCRQIGRIRSSAIWFEELTAKDWYSGARPDIDAAIQERFGALYEYLAAGVPDAAISTGKGALAAIIVLDQFPRNMFRNASQAFATDVDGVGDIGGGQRSWTRPGHDAGGTPIRSTCPTMHSEDLAVQVRSIELFESLGDASVLDFARRHKDVIERFGRFPHRNAILGRTSTADEQAYLAEPGSGF